MARSPFPDPSGERLPPTHSDLLLDVAERSILDGLGNRGPTVPPLAELPDELRRPVGTFVTLNVHGRLNGCIGSIETDDALAVGVARHAWSAAFSDPRLPALRWVDYEHLDIEISILSPLAPMVASSRGNLLGALEPGVDGLLIAAGSRTAVFLPSVWEQLPSPETFLTHLFHKAGLNPSTWPAALRAYSFTAEKFGRRAGLEPRVALWSDAQYRDAFAAAGLDVEHDADGLIGRGLYLGHRPRD